MSCLKVDAARRINITGRSLVAQLTRALALPSAASYQAKASVEGGSFILVEYTAF